jgi:hypothetical protein
VAEIRHEVRTSCRTLRGGGGSVQAGGREKIYTHTHTHMHLEKFFQNFKLFFKGRGVLLCEVLVCVIALESSPTIQETQDLSALPPYYTATALELQAHFVYNIHYA